MEELLTGTMSEKSETPQTPYEILGDEGIKELAHVFYEVMDELPLAADIRAMHAENLDSIKRMLTAYLNLVREILSMLHRWITC